MCGHLPAPIVNGGEDSVWKWLIERSCVSFEQYGNCGNCAVAKTAAESVTDVDILDIAYDICKQV